MWSLKSFKSHQQEDILSASASHTKQEFSGGIFCQKSQETEEPPAFLKLHDFHEREDARGNNTDNIFIEEIGNSFDAENIDSEEKKSKCLIVEVDQD